MLALFTRSVISRRKTVFAITLLLTVLALFSATRLRIIIDPAAILPQSHPFVASKSMLEGIFGEKYTLVITVTPKSSAPLDAVVLEKIQRITESLRATPGVIKSTLMSVASQNAKTISGNSDGFEVKPFAAALGNPKQLQEWLQSNPIYRQAIVSGDMQTLAVLAQFEPDPMGYGAILKRVRPLIDRERDESVTIHLGGHINFLGEIELYSERMIYLIPLAIVLIALLLFYAFRSLQGMLLPLLTANLALICVLGIMGASGVPLDVFNATTPILILAVAAGHAVQILKRYYEEYGRLRMQGALSPEQASHEAIVNSASKVGRFMIASGLIAAMGFLSLMVFKIRTVKTFGLFTGLGILSALLIELTFMPALRSWLKPPEWPLAAQNQHGLWHRIIGRLIVWTPTRIPFVLWFVIVSLALAGTMFVRIENSNKANFAEWTEVRKDDATINRDLAGTQTFYIMIDSVQPDGIKRTEVLQGIESLQRMLEHEPGVGKTVSIADFLKRMNQAMKDGRSEAYALPESPELAGQYLLLYSMSGDPDDLKSFVDFDYRRANLKVYVRQDDSPFIMALVKKTQALSGQVFPQGVKVSFGGGVAEAAAINEVLVHDKLLNIAQIIGVVFLASALLFRSVTAGLLVLLPLLIAVLVNFGLLGWLGIPLNIPTSLISAMAVGIGADYAIYLISRYREEVVINASDALEKSMHSAGAACLYVAASVAVGYGVLALSFGFKVHQWLALLIASAMFVSVFATLMLIPAILIRFKPGFLYVRLERKL